MHSVEIRLQMLNFCLSGLAMCNMPVSRDAGQLQEATAPSEPCEH